MAKRSSKSREAGSPSPDTATEVQDDTLAPADAPLAASTGSARRRAALKPEPVEFTWPFGMRNLIVLGIAIAVIVLGYVFLGQGPYDSVSSLTVGPVLLVIGYLILLPAALLVRDKAAK